MKMLHKQISCMVLVYYTNTTILRQTLRPPKSQGGHISS